MNHFTIHHTLEEHRPKWILPFCSTSPKNSMAHFHVLFLFLVGTIVFFFNLASSQENCTAQYCGTKSGLNIRFPFRLKGGQSNRCGYPKFDLSCENNTTPILSLPYSGEFVVETINYARQTISLNDHPGNCLPRRLMSLNISDASPFGPLNLQSYTFFNCSDVSEAYHFPKITCLSGDNYSVVALPSASLAFSSFRLSSSCSYISQTLVPIDTSSPYTYRWQLPAELTLTWNKPDCSSCEVHGGTCGFKSSSGLDIQCTNIPSHGLPRSVKYGVGFGVGIPGLAGLIVCWYACCRIKRRRMQQLDRRSVEFPTIIAQHHPRMAIMGLDKPTIESYPMTVLGESCRLPKANDGTCPICLSEYQSKDTLRTIPECNHYYHAQCIDEWLKLNATCPLCRNSPDVSSAQSPSSTASLSSSTLTSVSTSP